jgi:hypothetical protein
MQCSVLLIMGLVIRLSVQLGQTGFVEGRLEGPTISGFVLDESGRGLGGVRIRTAPDSFTTMSRPDGYYQLTVPWGWSGFVLAQHVLYTLNPMDRTYDEVVAPLEDQDFSAEPNGNAVVFGFVRTHDGRPSPATLLDFKGSGDSQGVNETAISQANGSYALGLPAGWRGTIATSPNHRLEPAISEPFTVWGTLTLDFTVFRNWYVAPEGRDDQESGFVDRPFRTVQKGTNRARPGDSIILREGLYDLRSDPAYEADTIHFRSSGRIGRPITVQAFAGESVTLTTAESKPIFDFSDTWGHRSSGFGHFVFRGLRITGGRYGWLFRPPVPADWQLAEDPVAALETSQIHDVLIEDCEVDGNGTVESAVYARNGGVRNLAVRRCDFHHTIGTEGTVDIGEWRDDDPAHLIPRSASRDLLFEDCAFHDAVHQQANGIVIQPCNHRVTFRRCRAFNNGKYGFACKGSGEFRLDRCAAWGNDSSQMYCRGFGGDDDTGRPFALNDFLITNCIFIAPADQRGGAALNWRENCDLRVFQSTIVGLRDAAYDQAGGFAFLLGSRHDLPSAVTLRNCIVAGYGDSPAMRMFVTSNDAFVTNVRYEARGNLFFAESLTKFKYQSHNWNSLAEWQAYWATGEPDGDNALRGPRGGTADAISRLRDPRFVRLIPSQTPLRKTWTADLFDAANFADVRVVPWSPALRWGENLTSLGIPELQADYFGDSRPAVGGWSVGAIQNPVAP